MPCTRAERQRPRFEPIALPSRPVIPVGEAPTHHHGVSPSSTRITTTGKEVESYACRPALLFSADEIVQGLFLGTSGDALHMSELERLGIKNILNVATECDVPDELLQAQSRGSLNIKKIHMIDHSDYDIAKSFPECNEFILGALLRGEGVLVHCRMGVSRSAAVVIAFLMQYGGIYFPSKQRNFEARAAAAAAAASSKTCTPRAYAASYACESPQVNTNPHRIPSKDNLAQDVVKSPSVSSAAASTSSAAASPNLEHLRQCEIAKATYPMTYADAFDIVKARRCQVAPNLGFCLALRELDVERGVLGDIWDFSDSVGL